MRRPLNPYDRLVVTQVVGGTSDATRNTTNWCELYIAVVPPNGIPINTIATIVAFGEWQRDVAAMFLHRSPIVSIDNDLT